MIALCIGHSRRIRGLREGGAIAADGRTCEHAYNLALGHRIADRLEDRLGRRPLVVADYQGADYSRAMAWLAAELKREGVRLAIELHFNSAAGKASGHEWLYWHSSLAGRKAALALHLAVAEAFPRHPQRGCKGLGAGSRGAGFLRATHCPAVIAEPFFGDHPADWAQFAEWDGFDRLAAAMAAGLANPRGI